MKSFRSVATIAALVIGAAAQAQSSPPAQPAITAGAGLKAIRLDWEPVAGAMRYEMWHRSSSSAPYVKAADYPAAATHANFRVPVHLFDWQNARFRVDACNAAGCRASAPIGAEQARLDAVGYFKSNNSARGMLFGYSIDSTPGGTQFVAAAPGETVNGFGSAGAAYLFRRGSNGVWYQRARLLPGIVQTSGGALMDVSINGDGNTVAMGMPMAHLGPYDGAEGFVYVFRYDGTGWMRATVRADGREEFGRWVSIDDAGNTLAISHVHGADVFELTDGAWLPVATIAHAAEDEICPSGALSGDGRVLARNCFRGTAQQPASNYLRVHRAPSFGNTERVGLPWPYDAFSSDVRYSVDIDSTGTRIAAQSFDGFTPVVKVVERGAGAWVSVGDFSPGLWQAGKRSLFGGSIGLSADGRSVAIGDSVDTGAGTGVQRPPLAASNRPAGAVYVFRVDGTGNYAFKSIGKPNYPFSAGGYESFTFGTNVVLNANGNALLVGQYLEASNARGIEGAWNNVDAPQSGAVWLY